MSHIEAQYGRRNSDGERFLCEEMVPRVRESYTCIFIFCCLGFSCSGYQGICAASLKRRLCLPCRSSASGQLLLPLERGIPKHRHCHGHARIFRSGSKPMPASEYEAVERCHVLRPWQCLRERALSLRSLSLSLSVSLALSLGRGSLIRSPKARAPPPPPPPRGWLK